MANVKHDNDRREKEAAGQDRSDLKELEVRR